jgi:hypothetical protein
MLAATVSGSFHRHMTAISDAVRALHDAGVRVLSPADPRVVDEIGPFLFVASDRHRSVRLVQDRHLAAICASSFLWLVCPDGYVGQSAALELGFAIARGISIFGEHLPADITLRQYVQRVESVVDGIQMASSCGQSEHPVPSLLIDPATAIESVHEGIETIGQLLQPLGGSSYFDPFNEVTQHQRRIAQILALPSK